MMYNLAIVGTFFLTNVRVVWHANLASNFVSKSYEVEYHKLVYNLTLFLTCLECVSTLYAD